MSISAAAAAVLVRGKLLLRRNMSMGMVIRSWLACVRNVKFMIAAVSFWPAEPCLQQTAGHSR